MARDRKDSGYHQREENPHQGASHSFGVPDRDELEGITESPRDESQSGARESSQFAAPQEPPERERSIETGREQSRDRGGPPPITGPARSATPQPSSSPSQAPARSEGANVSPFSLMRRMAEDMDRMFQDFGLARRGLGLFPAFGVFDREFQRGRAGLESIAWTPQVETARRGERFIVRADLPGLKKEDVNVEVQGNVLSISGERRSESEEERDDVFRSERSYGRFYRAFTLPENVDANQCDATFRDGVLEVSFAARPANEKRGKQIPIR